MELRSFLEDEPSGVHVETSPMMVWVADENGEIRTISRSWLEFTGCTQEQLAGQGWLKLVHPEDLALVMKQFGQLHGNEDIHLAFRMLRSDGTYRWISQTAITRLAPDHPYGGIITSSIDITDPMQREDRLRSLSRATEQSPACVVITDLQGNIEYVNQKFCQLTGYSAEEVLGKNPRILKSGETPAEEYQKLWNTIREGGDWHGVFHNRKKNGDLYWERAVVAGITDRAGKVNHYLAIKEDITEFKFVEEELVKNKNRLDLIFNNPQVGIGMTDKDGRYIFVNQRCAEMLGYAIDELKNLRNVDITHPDDVAVTRRNNQALFNGSRKQYTLEKRFIRKDGSLFWGEVTATPILEAGGQIWSAIAFITDISERKKIEEKLRESEELYRTIIDASPDNITITDLSGLILFASPIASNIFGYADNNAWVGKRILDFVFPEDQEKAQGNLRLMLEGGQPGMGEYRGLRQDGTNFYFEVNGAVLRGASGGANGFVFVLRDISERKRLEAEQRQRVQELEALQATMNDISSKLDLPRVLNSIVERVVTLLVVGQCEIGLFDPANNHLKVVVSYNLERNYTGVVLAMGEGAMGKAAQSRKMISVEDYGLWEGRSPQYEPVHTAVIAVPLVTQQELLGVLSVGTDHKLRKFDQRDIDLIELFAQQAAVAIQNAKLFSEVQRLAITDSLTGLHNRGAFFDRARQEFRRSERYEDPLSLIMLDVDHFKRINDRFGHAAGDIALQIISGLCLKMTRVADLLGRYGGEEFVILLPETNLEGAEKTAQRLCEEIRNAEIQSERGEIRVTVSVGVAQVTPEVHDLDQLLDLADQAMYRAKQGGRDRVSR